MEPRVTRRPQPEGQALCTLARPPVPSLGGAATLTVARSFCVSPLLCRPCWITLPTSRGTRSWCSSSVSRSSLAVFLVIECCLFWPAAPGPGGGESGEGLRPMPTEAPSRPEQARQARRLHPGDLGGQAPASTTTSQASEPGAQNFLPWGRGESGEQALRGPPATAALGDARHSQPGGSFSCRSRPDPQGPSARLRGWPAPTPSPGPGTYISWTSPHLLLVSGPRGWPGKPGKAWVKASSARRLRGAGQPQVWARPGFWQGRPPGGGTRAAFCRTPRQLPTSRRCRNRDRLPPRL